MRFLLIAAALLFVTANASASVIGNPTCSADVLISEQSKDHIIGSLNGDAASCGEFNGMAVKIYNPLNSDFDFETIRHLTLGVQPVSSMGPNGPVMGYHWNIVSAQTSNGALSALALPSIAVDIINPKAE